MPLTLGHIVYANCTPIFTALRDLGHSPDYRIVTGVPAQLNRLLAHGEIDVCPSSSIEYATHPDRYVILPDLSISAVGPVKSVMLFSRVPIEQLDGATIAMTTESDTSVNLLKIILGLFHRFTNRFQRTDLPLKEALEAHPGLLLIGDKALRGALAGTAPHVYDLGELWYRFTGLPFVFALWLVRREAAESQRDKVVRLGADLLEAKLISYESYPAIAAEAPERNWIGEEQLVDYWRTISYDLTPAHLDGLRLFFRHAAELGAIASAPEIRLFS